MKRYLGSSCLLLLLALAAMPPTASAATNHARIVRLSLVQGDVRFARSFQGDPLSDKNTVWESAPLNLPIRQGYVLATNSGRATVEFESGAMAFLNENAMIEFYDLSLHDGGRITRLVLRQGTGSFYVNPSTGDYFSVTGGDYTVEASGRTTFRLDNFDDGSTVQVEQGQVVVLRNDKSTPLEKGQSLSVQTANPSDLVIGRANPSDDFDRWVSGRIESVVTASNYSAQYVSSPNYSSGFADLYNYGSWFAVGGYGNCWRPFGVGYGWSPFGFGFGSWYLDPVFGWSFLGSAPWGWLPYHYGGWIFSPVYGWVWAPTGFGYGRPIYYRPVTAVWVRSGSTIGIVPVHPTDKSGRTPANLAQGVYPVQGRGIAPVMATAGQKWSVMKEVPRDTLSGNLVATASPTRVSRTIPAGASASSQSTATHGSSIVYDENEHRFVNTAGSPASANKDTVSNEVRSATEAGGKGVHPGSVAGQTTSVPPAPSAFQMHVPPRAPIMPTPARTSGGGASGGNMGGGHGSSGSNGSAHPSSTGSPHTSFGAPHTSGGGGHPH
jgi:hypothetical protein